MTGRSLDKANSAKLELEKGKGIKGTLSVMQLDVTDEKSVKEAAGHVMEQFWRLDALINNAALGGLGLGDIKLSLQRCLETNVIGPALVSEAFRPLISKSQRPYSIYVSSGAELLHGTRPSSRSATTIFKEGMHIRSAKLLSTCSPC